jgi:hypothetical protein
LEAWRVQDWRASSQVPSAAEAFSTESGRLKRKIAKFMD